MKLQLGLNTCSNAEYHADPAYLSSSVLKLLAKDPAEYYNQYILGNRTSISGMHLELGTLVHTMLLEPHLVDEEYAFYPGDIRAGNAYKAFAAQNSDRHILTTKVRAEAQALVTAAHNRPELMAYLVGGEPEQSICVQLDGVPVKMRADYINPDLGYILDLKTTRHPSGVSYFKEAVQQFDYGLSAALYTMVAQTHYNRPFSFLFGVLSKQDKVADLYKCSDATLAKGREEVYKALETYKQCMTTGIWASPEAEVDSTETMEQSEAYVVHEV